jgi:upstream activation factor subunit UAF30
LAKGGAPALIFLSIPKAPSSPAKPTAAARKPNAGFAKPVQPDEALAAVVCAAPLPRPELAKKLWEYIRAHKLQDPARKPLINADAKLKAVFDGKAQVNMFEMTKLVSGHVKPNGKK